MADAASQTGDADSSQAPGLTSGLQRSVNVGTRELSRECVPVSCGLGKPENKFSGRVYAYAENK